MWISCSENGTLPFFGDLGLFFWTFAPRTSASSSHICRAKRTSRPPLPTSSFSLSPSTQSRLTNETQTIKTTIWKTRYGKVSPISWTSLSGWCFDFSDEALVSRKEPRTVPPTLNLPGTRCSTKASMKRFDLNNSLWAFCIFVLLIHDAEWVKAFRQRIK